MAVIHGSKADFFMNGYDAGDFVNNVKTSHQRASLESTVLNNNGWKTYAKDNSSAKASANGFFDHQNLAAEGVGGALDLATGDYMLSTAMTSDTESVMCHFPGGALAVGDRGIGISGILNNYEFTTPPDNLGEFQAELEGCTGRESLRLLATLAARVDSFTGTTYDYGAAQTGVGGAAYLHVPLRTSGTLPVIIEHSDDGVSWSTIGTFANVTASHGFERLAITSTIKRYVRAAATGTYSQTFLVAIYRKA